MKTNLGFVLLKSDGNGLYATKDVLLAQEKFKEFDIQKNLYIVDVRQSLHFKQVFKVLEKVGFEQASACHHIDYEFVEVPDGAMSSRKGNIVPLMDLIKNMEETITKNYLEKYRGDWSDEEIKTTATNIANGAIKYGMVRMDNNRKIVFEMNEWLKLDGESGHICNMFSLVLILFVKNLSLINWIHLQLIGVLFQKFKKQGSLINSLDLTISLSMLA